MNNMPFEIDNFQAINWRKSFVMLIWKKDRQSFMKRTKRGRTFNYLPLRFCRCRQTVKENKNRG